MSELTPREIVHELDKHIIGQNDAKRAVAIALRNRWRRMNVPEKLRPEIMPKNILMIGPTGVGKTEIARRLARLAKAPFIKVEATKFTEVGYVGRDVESIIRDLVDVAVKMLKDRELAKVKIRAEDLAEDRILELLLPSGDGSYQVDDNTRQKMRKKLREGDLDDKDIEIELNATPMGMEIMGPPGMEDMTSQLQNMFQNLSSSRKTTRKLKVADALRLVTEEEAANLIDEEEIKLQAIKETEQNGIVFLDEIDKIAREDEGRRGGGVSRQGVQRDLLPLVEGSTVSTRYGMVKTDHILFISSGAFHLSKPSDLIPELQGRLPIRVELRALSVDDFKRILTEPDASLTEQYIALMATEGVNLEFGEDAVKKIAEVSWSVNENNENIGARRLHTVMERLLESLSFDASERNGEQVKIDENYVSEQLSELVEDEDLSRYIL